MLYEAEICLSASCMFNMRVFSNASMLCDELHNVLTGKHGFTSVANYYGWEPNYMIIDWTTHLDHENETADPEDLEQLGYLIQEIASRYGFSLIKLQGETGGNGNFYFHHLTPQRTNQINFWQGI